MGMEHKQTQLFDGILAILGGYGAMYLVTKTVITVLAVSAPEPSGQIDAALTSEYVAVILVGTLIAAIVGGVTVCLIAKQEPIKHTIALSAVAVILGIMTTLTGASDQPWWYSAALIGLSVIGIMSVGLIKQARLRLKARRP